MFQTDEVLRNSELVKYLDLPRTWKKDTKMKEAIEAYKYLSQTPSSLLLQAAYIGVDKVKTQLRDIDLNERDKGGKPIWNLKQFNDTLKAVASTVEQLDKAEKQFIKSQIENDKIRGNKNKSLYDGQDFSKINEE